MIKIIKPSNFTFRLTTEIMVKNGLLNDLNNYCEDIGCDILAKNYDNTYDYIQCKNYSTTGTDNVINICDLAGFYNFIAENLIHTGDEFFTFALIQS